ncbi:MAG: AAA family ATPase [Planctomycetes bacterium]|nr:AAA family ATPase [Planctomycetota bacterium]
MDLKQELAGLLNANVPMVNLVTYEEERVIQTLGQLNTSGGLGIVAWDLADGFQVVREGKQPFPLKDCTTDTLLPHLADKAPPGYVVVLKDFHHAWTQKKGYVTRKLRNMAPKLRSQGQCLMFVTPQHDLPIELKDDVVVLYVPLPDQPELERLFDAVTGKLDRSKLPRPEVKQKLVASAKGLTTTQARLAFSRVYAQHGCFDDRGIALVTWAKQQVIRESGALEFWPAEQGEGDVGGLDLMKAWLKEREIGFSEDARKGNVKAPRGVALIGIPGTGKSLSAKMLSGLWKWPLLRLDVAALFGSLLGESEQNMRKAIMLAETVSPCILWIDEMEKAFAGSGPNSLNAGAATRVFGTFLTWMQEHTAPVFVIATANDIEGLPAELMGRFDETFFLDLPNEQERHDIFRIHLERTGETYPHRKFRMEELVEKSRGMVGREIERVVCAAQFRALADKNREIEQSDLLLTLSKVIPLSKSHAEVIDKIRKWKTEGLASPASSEPTPESTPKRRVLETM